MKRTHIKDALQVTMALLITGGMASAMTPPVTVQPTPPHASTKIEAPKPTPKPVEAAQTPPAATPAVVPEPAPIAAPDPAPVAQSPPAGSHTDWMAAAGIAESDWGYVTYIVDHEGHWDPCVWNGGYSSCDYSVYGDSKAYGVCQSFPGSKMASAGADWLTSPVTQLQWCANYSAKYGGWYGSYQHWLAYGNW